MEEVQNYELVKKAYEYYVKYDRKELKETSDEYVEKFQRAVNNWLQFDDQTLFSDKKDNLLYSNGKHWARIGAGQMAKKNFILFLANEQTQELLRRLVNADFSSENHISLLKEYFQYRDSFSFNPSVYFPRAYTNRLFTILLNEYCTTIANEEVLRDVANSLGVFSNHKTFGELQIQVRTITDNCLKKMHVYDNLSTFDKAIIAWEVHIVMMKEE